MVLRFANHVENQVLAEHIPSSHAVVEVEACTWAVEANVLGQRAALSLPLEVATDLLLEVADLVEEVVCLLRTVQRKYARTNFCQE